MLLVSFCYEAETGFDVTTIPVAGAYSLLDNTDYAFEVGYEALFFVWEDYENLLWVGVVCVVDWKTCIWS